MTGQTISHYRILDKLGEGGMGVVYKADDTKLRRIVALKFLRPEASADATFKERFLREAQAGGALDHPNICAVHGLEESDGHIFLVMSFIDGASLSRRLRAGGALPLEEAIEIVLSTAEGLRAAHRKGIVHRDVKSANIMTAEAGVVKITDFGLALLEDRSRLTRSGTLMGTVDYMAPEQVQALETLDRRADIWALGIVLYELVTGSLPFHRDNQHASLRAILLDPTPKLQSAVPGVPADLDWILGKMLAKSPAERYQHLDDFLVDLRRVRQGLSPAQAKLAAPRREIGPDDATQTELRSALAPLVSPGQRSFWIAAAVFAAVLMAAIAAWWRFFSS